MERRIGQHHTSYVLTPQERAHVQNVDPFSRMAITPTPDGGGTISYNNDVLGKRGQTDLERIIKDGRFPIVDTRVPRPHED